MARLQFADNSRLAHAYILSARSREESVSAALELAAAAVCTSSGAVPCLSCHNCRKVLGGIHPDVARITRPLDAGGKPKREITVDQVRAMAADSYILPNEAARKVYIIEDADLMNTQAQNAALKLLEEPPAGVMFILCAENAQLLLPTVRSRCVELQCGERAAANVSEESEKLAQGYFKAVASGSASKLCSFCFANEGLDARAAAEFIGAAIERAADMLCGRADSLGLSSAQLVRIYELLRRCERFLRVNTSVKHIFGLLAVDSIAPAERKDK